LGLKKPQTLGAMVLGRALERGQKKKKNRVGTSAREEKKKKKLTPNTDCWDLQKKGIEVFQNEKKARAGKKD